MWSTNLFTKKDKLISMISGDRIWRIFQDFSRGVRAAFSNRKRAAASVSISVLVFVFMSLLARPVFSYQMISSNIFLLPETVKILFLYNSSNYIQMVSTVVYALLAGPAIVNLYLQLKTFSTGFKNVMSIAPGFVATGCMGCGAGLIGLLGLTGALAALPFNGLMITPLAILFLAYFITKSGDPEICSLE